LALDRTACAFAANYEAIALAFSDYQAMCMKAHAARLAG